MEKYLNIVQIISGVIGVALVFAGLFISIKKLNKEDSSEKIPAKTIKISTALIILGLLFYTVTKTCTNLSNADQEYSVLVVYLASLIDVIKFFGFIALIPILLNLIKRKPQKKTSDSEIIE